MMKFFRKYNKHLLAIFMVLLMIVFIGGSALQSLLQPSANHPVAKSKYGEVMFQDQQHASETTSLLETVGFPWQHPAGAEKPIELVDWILLQREAQALGTAVSPAAVNGTPMADALGERIEAVARRLRVRRELIYNAVAQLLSIEQSANGVIGPTTPSDAELSVAAQNALEKVKVQAVVLPAKAFIDPNANFSDADMKAHFEKYRERQKGQGLNFGYYQGTALKAQHLQIHRDAILSAINIPNLDKKARQFYDDNKEKDPRFRRAQDDKSPDPFRDGQFVGPPGPKAPYVDWEQAKDIATDAVRKQQADKVAGELANWILQYAGASWADGERGKDGYRVTPAGVNAEDYYKGVIERIPPNLSFPGAVTVGTTPFFSEKNADSVQPLSMAMFRSEHGMPKSFHALAFRSKPIVAEVPGKDSNQADYIAMYQTSQYPLTDSGTGDVFLFRLIDSKAAHAPESLDEVREQVVEDMRLQKGFEAARNRATSLASCHGAGDTLKAAFENDSELVAKKEGDTGHEMGYFDPVPFTRVPRGQAARGRLVSGMFVPNGVGTIPNDVVDGIFAMKHSSDEVRAFDLKDRAVVLVTEFQEITPSPEDEFNKMKKELVAQISRERRTSAINDWLNPDNIRARSQFELITR